MLIVYLIICHIIKKLMQIKLVLLLVLVLFSETGFPYIVLAVPESTTIDQEGFDKEFLRRQKS